MIPKSEIRKDCGWVYRQPSAAWPCKQTNEYDKKKPQSNVLLYGKMFYYVKHVIEAQ